MSVETAFLLYAGLYRCVVLIVGCFFCYLGYRLFTKGFAASVTQMKTQWIILKNAAPGTVFAAFGAAMIIAMVLQGNPEYLAEPVTKIGTKEKNWGTILRSEDSLSSELRRVKNDVLESDALANDILSAISVPLYVSGEQYLRAGRIGEARNLLSLAASFDPTNREAILALAGAYERLGDTQKAEELREQAGAM